ncbi:hypothetical protein EW145_g1954 [Phellinidium pouzarii]|uniref:Uncharacterized protein n=1 Tax=Phellinidium pouzarii TaxID=167371 RepID=A0A4S4LEJ6_9AGAM|nr:hypothetical protein EW145_g1954 [Phellinidium pouzarii]
MSRGVSLPECPWLRYEFFTIFYVFRVTRHGYWHSQKHSAHSTPIAGHTICKPCAQAVAKSTRPKCVLCSTPCGLDDLNQVVLSFGEYDPLTLALAAHPARASGFSSTRAAARTADADADDADATLALPAPAFAARSAQTLRLLDDLATSDPMQWARPRGGGVHDRGIAFVRAGRMVHDIGNSAILVQLGDALVNFQACYHNVADISSRCRALERTATSLRAELANLGHSHAKEIQRRDRDLAALRLAKTAREDELVGKMGELQKKLAIEREGRTVEGYELRAENVELKKELEKKNRKAVRFEKKYEVSMRELESLRKVIEIRTIQMPTAEQDGGYRSDSSLQFEDQGIDSFGENAPPPFTSSLASSASQNSRASEPASSPRYKLDADAPKAPSSSTLPSAKPAKKKRPLRHTTKTNLVSELPPSHILKERPSPDPFSDFVDTLLAPEMELKEAFTTAGTDSTRARAPRSRGALGQRPNTAGIPTNPLAARWASLNLGGREKKRQRLTLGDGDVVG